MNRTLPNQFGCERPEHWSQNLAGSPPKFTRRLLTRRHHSRHLSCDAAVLYHSGNFMDSEFIHAAYLSLARGHCRRSHLSPDPVVRLRVGRPVRHRPERPTQLVGHLHTIWFGPFDNTVSMFRPIQQSLNVIQFHLFHLNPFGYHLTSVSLHAIACVMVYLLARKLSSQPAIALCASLLFAVHAIHIEAIAWVSAYAEPLSDIFILAGLLSYLRFRRQNHDAKWLAVTCLWLFSGLLVKENVITLPFLILAYEFTFADAATRTTRAVGFVSGDQRYRVSLCRDPAPRFTPAAQAEVHLPISTLLVTLPSSFLLLEKAGAADSREPLSMIRTTSRRSTQASGYRCGLAPRRLPSPGSGRDAPPIPGWFDSVSGR